MKPTKKENLAIKSITHFKANENIQNESAFRIVY